MTTYMTTEIENRIASLEERAKQCKDIASLDKVILDAVQILVDPLLKVRSIDIEYQLESSFAETPSRFDEIIVDLLRGYAEKKEYLFEDAITQKNVPAGEPYLDLEY